jgi:hypothetical protein
MWLGGRVGLSASVVLDGFAVALTVGYAVQTSLGLTRNRTICLSLDDVGIVQLMTCPRRTVKVDIQTGSR